MDVIRTIKPGMPGSRRFQKHWGDKLVAVRYRRQGETLFTTIEIIVDERDRPPQNVSLNAVHSYLRQRIVAVRIDFDEASLRAAVKQSGGTWNNEVRAWLMTYNTAVVLGLQDRIVEGLAEKCTDTDGYFDISG